MKLAAACRFPTTAASVVHSRLSAVQMHSTGVLLKRFCNPEKNCPTPP